ncbi:MAG: SDR family oxidoreductase [Caulobacteraceae bacterium]
MTLRMMITGAASGIGAATAKAAAAAGYRVAVADIDLDGAGVVAQACGPDALAIGLDVTSDASWRGALDRVWNAFGGLDLLVNNAGVVFPGFALAVASADHERTLNVNFMGPLRGMLSALPRFANQGHGHFITVASMTAFMPFPGLASYAASKHALRAFHLGLAAEHRHGPVRFTLVHPGAVETPMLEREADCDDAALAFASDSIRPELVAQAVLAAPASQELELFVPAERGETVKRLTLDPATFIAGVDASEIRGRDQLRARRETSA